MKLLQEGYLEKVNKTSIRPAPGNGGDCGLRVLFSPVIPKAQGCRTIGATDISGVWVLTRRDRAGV